MSGELYIKGAGTNNDFVDAYTAFGMSFEDTGINRILAPAPNKQPVTNKNVVTDGAGMIGVTVGHKDDRTVTIPMHIVAPNKTTFDSYYDALCDLLDGGWVDIRLARRPNVTYHFVYIDCPQYNEYDGEMALFSLQLYEPDPTNRT